MINLELRGHIESCTSKQLDKLYAGYPASIILPTHVMAKCKKVSQLLGNIFAVRCPHINRSYALSLYWVMSRILDLYDIPCSEYAKIKSNFIEFDIARISASQRDYSDSGDDVYRDMSESMSRSTDGKDGIEIRHEILNRYLFQGVLLVPLPTLDPKQIFTYEEKLIIYYRDKGVCKLEFHGAVCGKPLSFDESVVDHIHPHSLGGKTEIDNGRLAHHLCNIARGALNSFDPAKDCKRK